MKQCHVDPNAASLDGCTPLHLAVTNGHLETTQYLIDGAQVTHVVVVVVTKPAPVNTTTGGPEPEERQR